jgi:hypothetical protein
VFFDLFVTAGTSQRKRLRYHINQRFVVQWAFAKSLRRQVNDQASERLPRHLLTQSANSFDTLLGEQRVLLIASDVGEPTPDLRMHFLPAGPIKRRNECSSDLVERERAVVGVLSQQLPAAVHIQAAMRAITHGDLPMSELYIKDPDNVKAD